MRAPCELYYIVIHKTSDSNKYFCFSFNEIEEKKVINIPKMTNIQFFDETEQFPSTMIHGSLRFSRCCL